LSRFCNSDTPYDRMALSLRARARVLTVALSLATLAACISSNNPTAPPAPSFDAGPFDAAPFDASARDAGAPQDATAPDVAPAPDGATPDGDLTPDAAKPDAAPPVDGAADSAPSDAAPQDSSSSDAAADASTGFGPSTSGVYAGAASADGSAMLLIDNYPLGYLFSHYDVSTGWTAITPLPFNSDIAEYPLLGMDSLGNAYVAWIASYDGGFVASFSRYDHPTHTWSAPQITPAAVDGQEIAFAVNSSGEAIILGGTTGAFYAAHYSGGASGTWTKELIAATGGSGFPAVAINDQGLAAAVYDGPGGATTVATRSASGAWTITGTGFSANAYQISRSITINAAGDVLAGWEALPQYAAAAYYASALPDAGAPVGPTVLPGSSAGSPFGIGGGQLVQVALSPSGDGALTHLFNPPTGKNEIDGFAFTKSTKTWGATQVMPGAATIQLVTFGGVNTGEIFAGFLNTTPATGSGPAVWSDFTPALASGWSAAPTPLTSNMMLSSAAPDSVRLFASPTGSVFAAWDEGNAAFTGKIR
jgi:hypothetical protein